MRMTRAWLLLVLVSCGGTTGTGVASPANDRTPQTPAAPAPVTITVIGTNDLHGHVRALPVLAGYLEVIREERAAEGGAVVLLDGGDMFQGTLESNLLEGAPVVAAYRALGYDAVTIGNHEFDYGPVGERATVGPDGGDPRGALLARAREAGFPFLTANVRMRDGGGPVHWDHVAPSVRFEKAGVEIGVIGVTTEDTLGTTLFANVADLAIEPIVGAVTREAAALRADGVDVVMLTAHAGGRCLEHDDPHDLSSCEPEQEIHRVAEALPEGLVDVIVAGHTHQAVSHIVNGIPIIESYSYGRAFGRVDLTYDADAHRVTEVVVHPPQDLCVSGSAEVGDCELGRYEGREVVADVDVAQILTPALENARAARDRALGVELSDVVSGVREHECALGNLVADLMLAARPDADLAMNNGGGLRADLPRGPLTYGAYYESSPFDNRFAFVEMTGADLRQIVGENLAHDGGILSFAGVAVEARCRGEQLEVRLRRGRREVRDTDRLTVVTTDYLATSGLGHLAEVLARDGAVRIEDGEPVREAVVQVLAERGGTVDPTAYYDPAHPRLGYPGERPVSCAEAPGGR